MLGEGDWSELPRNSQIFYDARLKLINTYQYHQDFYFGEETFLKVQYQYQKSSMSVDDLVKDDTD